MKTLDEITNALQQGQKVLLADFSERGHPINHQVILQDNTLTVVEFITKQQRLLTSDDRVFVYIN